MTFEELKDKKIELFEPGMITKDGLVGEEDPPELLFTASLAKTFAAHDITLHRYNLFDEPMEFITNKDISELLRQQGDEGFPAVVIDGKLVSTGHYPVIHEWSDLLGMTDLKDHLIDLSEEELEAIREKIAASCSGSCSGCSGCH